MNNKKKPFASVLNHLIGIYMLLVIVVMPFYNRQGYAKIGTDKSHFFRYINLYGVWFIVPALVMYLIFAGGKDVKSGLIDKKYTKKQIKLSLTDIFALIYGVSLILSFACSEYQDNALFGANGWFMGILSQVALLAIYFLISRFRIKTNWMFLLFFPVSAVVFLLGYLNRFGIYPIDMKIQNPEFISTIGNINWYCGYLVSVFFGGYYLLWQNGSTWNCRQKIWKQALLMVYVAIGFATLITQGSMSGLFALAVMLIVTFCLSAKNAKRMVLFWQETFLLSLMCLLTFCIRTMFNGQITYEDAIIDILTNSAFPVIAVIISGLFMIGVMICERLGKYPVTLFLILARVAAVVSVAGLLGIISMITINTLQPGSLGALSENPFFTFSPDWGSNRGATWRAGIACFAEQDLWHKLVGVGPDSMSNALYQSTNEELRNMLTERFGVLTLTNAHNEWITVLVNTGVLGFAGFVGMMISAIWRFLKGGLKGGHAILGACGFCLLAYSVNNMFSFQQCVNTATIFVIMGIGEAYVRKHALFGLL